jgi:hypothetical protein
MTIDVLAHLLSDASGLNQELARKWIMAESAGVLNALGDGVKAFGILQQHNDFRHDWAPPFALQLYALADIMTAANFVKNHRNLPTDRMLVQYNLGHPASGDPNDYLKRIDAQK